MKALAAEMARNFGKKLEPLGIAVRELTGDMQLSKKEIQETQVLKRALLCCYSANIIRRLYCTYVI